MEICQVVCSDLILVECEGVLRHKGLTGRFDASLGGHDLGSVVPHTGSVSPPRRMGDSGSERAFRLVRVGYNNCYGNW